MDTRTICLGVLSQGEATGYEIKKCIEDEFGFFLEVSHSAIYPALGDLHREGLLERREVRQDGRPDKKLYRLTEAGHRALKIGLAQSPGRHRVRSEFIALLLFAGYLPRGRVAALLDARLDEFERLVRFAQACDSDDAGSGPGGRFAAGLGACMMRAGIDYIRRNRGWLEAELAERGPMKAEEGTGT